MRRYAKTRSGFLTLRLAWQSALIVLLLASAALARFWQIGRSPAYDYDEPVYTRIASNLNHYGIMSARMETGTPMVTYNFHPPYYFRMLAKWFQLFGEGIASARTMAACMSIVVLGLLFVLLKRQVGWGWAYVGTLVLAFDGWLLFENRMSYIENTLMVFIVAGILVYQAAGMMPPSRYRLKASLYILAGVVIGFASMFKYIGAYVILAILINWLITRRENRYHLLMMGFLAGVVAAVLAYLVMRPGGSAYWQAITIQFQRTDGTVSSSGNITTLSDALGPLINQYRIYAFTLMAAGIAGLLMIFRLGQAAYLRSIDRIRPNSLFYAWAMAGSIMIVASKLRFPHYFIVVLEPLLLYLIVEVAAWVKRQSGKRLLVGFVVLALVAEGSVVAGAIATSIRMTGDNRNALSEAATFIRTHARSQDLVIADDPLAAIFPQRWCAPVHAYMCDTKVNWVVVYTTAAQKLSDDPAYLEILPRTVPVAKYSSFKDNIVIRRVVVPEASEAQVTVQLSKDRPTSARLTRDWTLVRLPILKKGTKATVHLTVVAGTNGPHSIAWKHWAIAKDAPAGYEVTVVWDTPPQLPQKAGQTAQFKISTSDGGRTWQVARVG